MCKSADTLTIRWPVMNCTRSSQCVPMSATARSSPPSSASTRQLKSVSKSSQSCTYEPVTCRICPVLPLSHPLGRLVAQRIEADVVRHARRPAGTCRDLHQFGRLAAGHGQRLLAQHVLAGPQGGGSLLVVVTVGRSDVDGLHVAITQDFIKIGVAPRNSLRGRGLPRLLRRAAENADDSLARTAEGFDMYWADEAGADDSNAERNAHGWMKNRGQSFFKHSSLPNSPCRCQTPQVHSRPLGHV